jgi:splicing factor 3A subunit 1
VSIRYHVLSYGADLKVRRQEAGAIGPGIGTAAAPPPLASLPPAPASLPAPPQATTSGSYSAATVSSGPQPASMYPNQNPPVMLPPLHYQGMDAAQPFGYQPPPTNNMAPPGMHPSRLAALAAGGPMQGSPQGGVIRSADDMDGGGEEQPPAKRQKIAKLPGGQYYPESDWINMHPVSYYEYL